MQRMAACLGLVCLVGLAGCGTPMVDDDALLARAEALLLGGQPSVVSLALSLNTLLHGSKPVGAGSVLSPGVGLPVSGGHGRQDSQPGLPQRI